MMTQSILDGLWYAVTPTRRIMRIRIHNSQPAKTDQDHLGLAMLMFWT